MSGFNFRQENLSHQFLPTSRTRKAEMYMELLLGQGAHANYCMALPLLGPPGCGKTHFALEYANLFEAKFGTKLRTLYIEVTANTSLKGLAADVLSAAGDPDPDYGTQASKTVRAGKLMKGRFDLVYLDEFHRLINRESQKVDKKSADWVTNFLNLGVCPIVMIGEALCERVFVDSRQFDDRTYATAEMLPFDWGVEEDRVEYGRIVAAFEIMVGMPQRSDLHGGDIPLRFYVFSRGLIRLTAQLMATAAWVARRQNCPSIRVKHLGEAVDLLRLGSAARKPNPFKQATVNPVAPAPYYNDETAG